MYLFSYIRGDFLYCPFLTDLFSARRRLCSIELPNVNSIHRFRFLSIAGVAPTSALCATQLKQGKQADSSTSGILMRMVYIRSKVLRSPLQTHLWTVILSSSNMRWATGLLVSGDRDSMLQKLIFFSIRYSRFRSYIGPTSPVKSTGFDLQILRCWPPESTLHHRSER